MHCFIITEYIYIYTHRLIKAYPELQNIVSNSAGRPSLLTKGDLTDLDVWIEQRGRQSNTPTVKDIAQWIQARRIERANAKGSNSFAIKLDEAYARKIVKQQEYNLNTISTQTARRTYALADIRNFVAAIVMCIVMFFDNPIDKTDPIPHTHIFNLDATVLRLMNDSAASEETGEKAVVHPNVKKENDKRNRSTTTTKGKGGKEYYRLDLYLTTSASGACLMPIIVIKNQMEDKLTEPKCFTVGLSISIKYLLNSCKSSNYLFIIDHTHVY
jgi:hypothetical protein